MNEEKLGVVRAYLNEQFPDAEIDEQYDFDRHAQTFRIRAAKNLFLLKVGGEFLDDNGSQEILAYLEKWEVGNLIRGHRDLGILVGNNPPVAFRRFAY